MDIEGLHIVAEEVDKGTIDGCEGEVGKGVLVTIKYGEAVTQVLVDRTGFCSISND